MTIPQALQIALQHHQAGRLAEAEALYRQILATQPNNADAIHYLGVIAHQAGRHELALEWIRKAITLNPNNFAAHSNLGESYRATGRFEQAIASYRHAIALKPDRPEAYFNLANALRILGRLDESIAACRHALELKHDSPEAHLNLGNAFLDRRQLDEAIASYHRALHFKSDYPEAHFNLGVALRKRGHPNEAIYEYRRALELRPSYPEVYVNLGAALQEQGQCHQAIAAFRRALHLKPDYPDAHYNLGNALRDAGKCDESMAVYRRAIEIKPDYVEAHNNLGAMLRERGQIDEAIAAYHRVAELKPERPEAYYNLGIALRQRGRLDEAIAAYRHALALDANYSEAHNNLAIALQECGQLEEAVAAFRKALKITPENASYHSNLIFALYYHFGHDVNTLAEEHKRWNHRFSDPIRHLVQRHTNEPHLDRRLRVGYVSPDFLDHAVGRYTLPLLECHDRDQFEILCYSGTARPDWLTQRLRALAGRWHNVAGVSDTRLSEIIRADKVDILVDLTMHAAHNRLPTFVRQPAPVQVAWLAYPGSTGLHSIAYRLTDAYIDPPGEKPVWSSEEPVRLPDCWCCYRPVGDYPEVNALPALSANGVTFGSLNNFAKVHDGVLRFWARVLRSVDRSRLLMTCPEGRTRERVRAFLLGRGVPAEQVEFVGFRPRLEYMRLHQRIDLGLDPFPYNGMTTTCDSLWMGVPVITLPGSMPASRAGLSLLSNVGLGELAANSEEDYLRIVLGLSENLPRLATLRATMRQRMQASPLMDAPRFARNVESAYRSMWRAWCNRPPMCGRADSPPS